jgi:hypothetical protein
MKAEARANSFRARFHIRLWEVRLKLTGFQDIGVR